MTQVVVHQNHIGPMSGESMAVVDGLEVLVLGYEQEKIETWHTIHGGIYTRTIVVPAGVMLTGAEIKIPTSLVIVGACYVYTEEGTKELRGTNLLTCSAGRKQAFLAIDTVVMTMMFPTSAKTVEEAEAQFTDDVHNLMSRHDHSVNHVKITGE